MKKKKTCFDCLNCKVSAKSTADKLHPCNFSAWSFCFTKTPAIAFVTVASMPPKEKSRLCFCAKSKTKKLHREDYWAVKPVCKKFEDMRA
jgi:hypothetical protein